MSITIDLKAQEVAALKQLSKLEDDAEAVATTAREFFYASAACANQQALEGLELSECSFPQ